MILKGSMESECRKLYFWVRGRVQSFMGDNCKNAKFFFGMVNLESAIQTAFFG